MVLGRDMEKMASRCSRDGAELIGGRDIIFEVAT